MDDRVEHGILEKARYVREAVQILDEVRDSTTLEEYCEDRRTRDVVEREFQTAIEACIDVGEVLLSAHGVAVPDRNADVFRELQARGVLDDETADRMAEAAGFRNVLAHQYGTDLDDTEVYATLEDDLDVFTRFLSEVRDELDS